MAEKEYIEREAAYTFFKDQLEEETGAYSKGRNAGLRVAMSAVMNKDAIPAADVRPVVRGKWSIHEIYKHEMSYGVTGYEPVYKCSVCGSLIESYLRFDEPIMPEDAGFPRFCPNCGADMRES